MSKCLFYIAKKANARLTPDAKIFGAVIDGQTSLIRPGKIVIEVTQDSLVRLGAGLLRWATVPAKMLDTVNEAEPISAALGAFPLCGTFLHPESNAVAIFAAEAFTNSKAPPLVPASPENIAIDLSNAPGVGPATPNNVIKVYALDDHGNRQDRDSWLELAFSLGGIIAFASELVRLSKEPFIIGKETSVDDLCAGLFSDGMPVVLRFVVLPAVEDLLRQVGFKGYE